MNREDIIDLGHKAGTLFITQFGVASVTVEWLENFAALVAAAEREACAKACEARFMGDMTREDMEARRCAAAIRARGNT